MNATVYFNGELRPKEQTNVGVDNGGWLHGAGLFETMRAENGRVFRFDRHIERLRRSAEALIRPIEMDQLPDGDTIGRLLRANSLDDARVRLTVTAGAMVPTSESDGHRPMTVCATASPLLPYSQKLYDAGVVVLISKFRQSSDDPIAGHKTTNYLGRLMALSQAHDASCDEAIWFSTNNLVAEGCISNVFIVKDGAVFTPACETPVLPGIARATVLELCCAEGIVAAEKPLNINDLLDADEVFLTNAIMQVMPVRSVEKHRIGEGEPGPVAKRLLGLYKNRVEAECACDEKK